MSIPTLLHVLNISKAKKSHRLVLIEIANHVNDNNGLAWPSKTTIARRTGLSRQWVIAIINELVAVGELKIIPGAAPNGEHAYSIPGCQLSSHPPCPGCQLTFKKGVNSVYTESYIEESLFRKKSGGEGNGEEEAEQRPLTRLEALKLGLTPGSKFFRFITGQSEE